MRTAQQPVEISTPSGISSPVSSSVSQLRFIADRDGEGRCFWNVKPTGSYGKDCNVGQAFALEYLAYEEANGGGTILPLIVGDMPRELTGIEVGFLELVGFAATDGAYRARDIVAYWERCKKERRVQRSARSAVKP